MNLPARRLRLPAAALAAVALTFGTAGCSGDGEKAGQTAPADVTATSAATTPAQHTSSDDAPGATTSSPSSSSSSSSSSASTPARVFPSTGPYALPEAAKQRTKDGAIAYAKHYYSAMYASYTHPTSGQLTKLGTSSCGTCAAMEQQFSQLAAKKQRYVYKPPTIRSATAQASGDPLDYAEVKVSGYDHAITLVNSRGGVIERYAPGGNFANGVSLVWESDGWRISGIGPA